jgi:hypothetical protein
MSVFIISISHGRHAVKGKMSVLIKINLACVLQHPALGTAANHATLSATDSYRAVTSGEVGAIRPPLGDGAVCRETAVTGERAAWADEDTNAAPRGNMGKRADGPGRTRACEG